MTNNDSQNHEVEVTKPASIQHVRALPVNLGYHCRVGIVSSELSTLHPLCEETACREIGSLLVLLDYPATNVISSYVESL